VRCPAIKSAPILTPSKVTVYKDADLYDFINAPIGKGLAISQPLRPLIAGKLSVLYADLLS